MLSWWRPRDCKSRREGDDKKRQVSFVSNCSGRAHLISPPQERRMKQQRNALLKERETAEKVAARAFAQSYLSDLVPSVFSTLTQNGFFYDPVERGINTKSP